MTPRHLVSCRDRPHCISLCHSTAAYHHAATPPRSRRGGVSASCRPHAVFTGPGFCSCFVLSLDVHSFGPLGRGRSHETHANGEDAAPACVSRKHASGGLGRHCPAQLRGSVRQRARGADERGAKNSAESRAYRMGAPVRFQKAVSRSKENAAVKRRKACRPASCGRPFPSAEGTGPTARRPPGAAFRTSASRRFAPLGAGDIPQGGRAHAPPERWSLS
jgi:hypothetical protein